MHIEGKSRLIEEPDGCVCSEENGESYTLTHARREFPRHARQHLRRQSHTLQESFQQSIRWADPACGEKEGQILTYGKAGIQLHLGCRHRENAAIVRSTDRLAIQCRLNLPFRWKDQTTGETEQRRFAAPIPPCNGGNDAAMKGTCQLPQNFMGSEAVTDLIKGDFNHIHSFHNFDLF